MLEDMASCLLLRGGLIAKEHVIQRVQCAPMSSNVCSVIHDAAERDSNTVAKTSSDNYEDGICVNVRLVRMQDLICDGGSREETELDMQLATCPRRETSRTARLGVVLSFACCSTRFQHAALQFVVRLTSNARTKSDRIPLHTLRTPR
jgi:hypothetical protein